MGAGLQAGREVAIETLPEEFAKNEERLARFEREAKLLASLNHPNIAGIYGIRSLRGRRTGIRRIEIEDKTCHEPTDHISRNGCVVGFLPASLLKSPIRRGVLRSHRNQGEH